MASALPSAVGMVSMGSHYGRQQVPPGTAGVCVCVLFPGVEIGLLAVGSFLPYVGRGLPQLRRVVAVSSDELALVGSPRALLFAPPSDIKRPPDVAAGDRTSRSRQFA
jgi:hypothetical protein